MKWWNLAFWATLVVITWLLLGRPPSPGPSSIPHLDKIAHFGVYAIAAGCATLGRLPWWLSLSIITVHGGVMEVLQGLGGVRQAEWADWVADVLGGATALAVIGAYRRLRVQSNHSEEAVGKPGSTA